LADITTMIVRGIKLDVLILVCSEASIIMMTRGIRKVIVLGGYLVIGIITKIRMVA